MLLLIIIWWVFELKRGCQFVQVLNVHYKYCKHRECRLEVIGTSYYALIIDELDLESDSGFIFFQKWLEDWYWPFADIQVVKNSPSRLGCKHDEEMGWPHPNVHHWIIAEDVKRLFDAAAITYFHSNNLNNLNCNSLIYNNLIIKQIQCSKKKMCVGHLL